MHALQLAYLIGPSDQEGNGFTELHGDDMGGAGAASTGGALSASVTTWATFHVLRFLLLTILSVCEPIVRIVLSLLSLAGLFTVGLYYFGGSPRLKVSFGVLLEFSLGCALVLALYERLIGFLKR